MWLFLFHHDNKCFMETKINAHMPDEVFHAVSRLANASHIPLNKALELCFNLGAPMFEALYVSGLTLPIMQPNESADAYEKRIRLAVEKPVNYASLVKKREGSILLAYIRFLESHDGHPQRFFFRDPELGRIIATPDTIEQLKKGSSPLYASLAQDVAHAERQWVARWVSHVESMAKGDRRGCFDALKWVMERDHGWLAKTEVKPDLERLAMLFGCLQT
jgi:hypothetical protein